MGYVLFLKPKISAVFPGYIKPLSDFVMEPGKMKLLRIFVMSTFLKKLQLSLIPWRKNTSFVLYIILVMNSDYRNGHIS